MKELTEKGLNVLAEMAGRGAASHFKSKIEASAFGASFSQLAVDVVFGNVWSRGGLDKKQRSLVAIAIAIAQGQLPELKNLLKVGIRSGLTPEEVEETIIQSAAYVGFPAANDAITMAIEAYKDIDANSK